MQLIFLLEQVVNGLVLGGYYLLQAADDATAEALAAGCPHLEGRQWIELRRVETLG